MWLNWERHRWERRHPACCANPAVQVVMLNSTTLVLENRRDTIIFSVRRSSIIAPTTRANHEM
jgi:hypothetical protein